MAISSFPGGSVSPVQIVSMMGGLSAASEALPDDELILLSGGDLFTVATDVLVSSDTIAAAGGLIGQSAVLQADFPKTNNTLTTVTGWSKSIVLEAGKTYAVTANIGIDLGPVGGAKFDWAGGTATATLMNGLAISFDPDNGTSYNPQTGLTGTTNFASANSQAIALVTFTIHVGTGGTLIPRFAQATTDAGASSMQTVTTYQAVEIVPLPVYP